MVPLGTKSAASLPRSVATVSSSFRTVGSSPYTSSPTSALAMASRIAREGRVTVSLRRSIIGRDCTSWRAIAPACASLDGELALDDRLVAEDERSRLVVLRCEGSDELVRDVEGRHLRARD